MGARQGMDNVLKQQALARSKEIYQQVSMRIQRAFSHDEFKRYYHSLSHKALLAKAVEMYVGSRSCPKNYTLMADLLQRANEVSVTEQYRNDVDYYRLFFRRADAMKNNDTVAFDETSAELMKLATKLHPQSCFIVGKELYLLLVKQYFSTSDEFADKEIVARALENFYHSFSETNYAGLYYYAEILRHENFEDVTQDQINELYMFGAALGDSLACFKVAKIYYYRKKKKLYMKYLKEAAESGVISAQHNLANEYMVGKNVEKDDIKAYAWFKQAAIQGFIYSKFNLALLCLKGSACGRLKPNKFACYAYIKDIKKMEKSMGQYIEYFLQQDIIKQVWEELSLKDTLSVEEMEKYNKQRMESTTGYEYINSEEKASSPYPLNKYYSPKGYSSYHPSTNKENNT